MKRLESGTLRDNAAALDSFVSSKARFEPLGVTDAGVEDDAACKLRLKGPCTS